MATLGAQKKHKVTIVGSGNWYVPPTEVRFNGTATVVPSACQLVLCSRKQLTV
jgi:hypothetical protein